MSTSTKVRWFCPFMSGPGAFGSSNGFVERSHV